MSCVLILRQRGSSATATMLRQRLEPAGALAPRAARGLEFRRRVRQHRHDVPNRRRTPPLRGVQRRQRLRRCAKVKHSIKAFYGRFPVSFHKGESRGLPVKSHCAYVLSSQVSQSLVSHQVSPNLKIQRNPGGGGARASSRPSPPRAHTRRLPFPSVRERVGALTLSWRTPRRESFSTQGRLFSPQDAFYRRGSRPTDGGAICVSFSLLSQL